MANNDFDDFFDFDLEEDSSESDKEEKKEEQQQQTDSPKEAETTSESSGAESLDLDDFDSVLQDESFDSVSQGLNEQTQVETLDLDADETVSEGSDDIEDLEFQPIEEEDNSDPEDLFEPVDTSPEQDLDYKPTEAESEPEPPVDIPNPDLDKVDQINFDQNTNEPEEDEDLFADFLNDDEVSQSAAEESPAIQEKSDATEKPTINEPVQDQKQQDLEELYSESTSEQDFNKSGDILDTSSADLSLEYQVRKKKFFTPEILKMIGAGAGAVVVISLALAFFLPNGFLGLKFGRKSTSDYQPPSAQARKRLNEKYSRVIQQSLFDRTDHYQKMYSELQGILEQDTRHKLSLTKIVEIMALYFDYQFEEKKLNQAKKYLADSEKFYPDDLSTIRSKARLQIALKNLTEAYRLAQKAQNIDGNNPDNLLLMGEISFLNQKYIDSKSFLIRAKELNPIMRRAPFFLAMSHIKLGEYEDAKSILVGLSSGDPIHYRSKIELAKIDSMDKKNIAVVQKTLEEILSTKSSLLSIPVQAEAWAHLAHLYEREENYPKSVEFLSRSLSVLPLDENLRFKMGLLYFKLGEFEKASNDFRQATNLNSKNVGYLIYLGRSLRKSKKPVEAIKELNKALELDPKSVDALFERGLSQRDQSLLDDALSSFEKIIQLQPDQSEALLELGELYVERSKFDKAEQYLKNVLEVDFKSTRALIALAKISLAKRQYNQALNYLKRGEKAGDKSIELLLQTGKSYLATGSLKRAESYIRRASKLDETNIETQRSLGDLYLKKKQYTKSMDIFQSLIQKDRRDFVSRVGLAKNLYDQKNYTEAITELEDSLKYNPKYFEAKMYLGMSWREAGDLDRSLDYLKEAAIIRRQSPEIFYQIALTHIYRADSIKALEASQKALKLDPRFVEPLVALGDFYRTQSYFDRAIDYYMRAYEINPSNVNVGVQLAKLYYSDRRYKLSKKYYEKVVKIDPRNSEGFIGLGLIADQSRNLKLAASYYQKARNVDPKNPKPYYYLGFVYRYMGKRTAAVSSFENYLALEPNSKEREDILEQIRLLTR